MWHGKDNPPHQSEVRQRDIGRRAEAAPVRGDDHVLQLTERFQAKPRPQRRMFRPASQHVAFAKQQALMQPRRRALAGMKEKIYCIVGRLLLQPRRLQFEYRQPTAGRGLA